MSEEFPLVLPLTHSVSLPLFKHLPFAHLSSSYLAIISSYLQARTDTGVTSSPQGLQPSLSHYLDITRFPLLLATFARMLSFSHFTKARTLATFSSYTCLDLILQVCSKVTFQLCFARSCVCSGWLPAALPEPLSLLLHPALSLWRLTPMDHIKGLRCAFPLEWARGGLSESKRMKKVRNQPLRSLLATLSRVDPAFLQKKQCSPPRGERDCIHSPWGCYNKSLQTWWLKAAETCPLTVLEVRVWRAKCRQGHAPWGSSEGICALPLRLQRRQDPCGPITHLRLRGHVASPFPLSSPLLSVLNSLGSSFIRTHHWI